jgi:hypothetical protein
MMRHSRSSKRNPNVEDWTSSFRDRGNLEFFGAALEALKRKDLGNGGLMLIGLLGQRDIPGYTLRTAQSVLRWDMRPSLWSHVFLVGARIGPDAEAIGKAPVLEVSLHPRDGRFPQPDQNGVSIVREDRKAVERGVQLRDYQDPRVDANAALVAVKMSDEDAERVRLRAMDPNFDRARYDLWESLGIWQGYLWSHGARPNPLREGVPVFSSSYAEMAFEAINLDITPGASERNSAPEHIWNGAVWWHEAFREEGHPMSGYYVLRDPGCSMRGTDEQP